MFYVLWHNQTGCVFLEDVDAPLTPLIFNGPWKSSYMCKTREISIEHFLFLSDCFSKLNHIDPPESKDQMCLCQMSIFFIYLF